MNRNVQGLRAFAAYAVVMHHVIDSLNNYIAHFDIRIDAGAAGVDLFFVISGFIMAATTSARPIGPAEFFMHRLIRIVPLYWLLTLISAALLFFGFRLFGKEFSETNLLQSLFFIPNPKEFPVLFVGWTLNYEMMFYTMFAICLFIKALPIRMSVICGLIAALWFIGLFTPAGSFISYISNGIILNFLFGIICWCLSRRYFLPRMVSIFCIIFGIVGLIVPDLFHITSSKELILAPSAFLLVLAAVSLEEHKVSIGDGLIARQGDASYSIYLLHPFLIQFVGKAAIALKLTSSTIGLCLTVALMFIAVAIAGTLFHRGVEFPITRRLKKWFYEPRAIVASGTSLH